MCVTGCDFADIGYRIFPKKSYCIHHICRIDMIEHVKDMYQKNIHILFIDMFYC